MAQKLYQMAIIWHLFFNLNSNDWSLQWMWLLCEWISTAIYISLIFLIPFKYRLILRVNLEIPFVSHCWYTSKTCLSKLKSRAGHLKLILLHVLCTQISKMYYRGLECSDWTDENVVIVLWRLDLIFLPNFKVSRIFRCLQDL